MAEQVASEHADFFISYTVADQKWAEWIAWHLEQADYTTIIQAWDFRPGNNFVMKMDEATKRADRTIVVLSPQFFASSFTPSEWATAFARDPKGEKRLVVPVLIEKADVAGLLKQIVYVDLTDKDGEAAVSELLAGIQPGRSKPTAAPEFPGRRTSTPEASSVSAPKPPVVWQFVQGEANVLWRSDVERYSRSGPAVLELQLVAVEEQLIPVRQLAELSKQLVEVGRGGGLFSATQEIAVDSSADHVLVQNVQARDSDEVGLLVTRRGQRGSWIELPNDSLGSVFDSKELTPRVAAVLQLLTTLDAPLADRYIIAAKLSPLMMLSVGEAKIVGNRGSASMGMFSADDFILPVEDSVNSDAIKDNASEIASEIIARLEAGIRR